MKGRYFLYKLSRMSFLKKLDYFFIAGILIILICYLPIAVLRDSALLVTHDQLDGEVLSYILSAKHLFDHDIPELFDGALKTAVTPPAPLMVLSYLILPYYTAFLFNYILIAIIAFIGMYLFLKEILNIRWIAFCVAVIYTMLPFYSVYGLSIMGQPLLLYAGLLLWKGKKIKKAFALIALFGVCSSLVLVGYADLLIFLSAILVCMVKDRKICWRMTASFLELLVIYVIMNAELLKEMLIGNEGFVSHKSELMAESMPVREAFRDMFFNGQYHAVSLQSIIVYVAIIAFFVVITNYKYLNKTEQIHACQFSILLIYTILVALFYAFWKFKPVVDLRNELGGIFSSFQADRFYWTYPAVWYIILAYVLYFITILWSGRCLFTIGKIVNIVLIFFVGMNVWNNSNVQINWNKLVDSDYSKSGYLSWNDFYATDMFSEIIDYIGKDTSTYKVGSVGLYPSIALYNGFYCIDGYSNNYSLEYKHEFRKIIAEELEKDDDLKTYFDEWGNRCYLFSSEIPFQYYFTKNSKMEIEDWDVNINQLKNMGCDYILSTIKINNQNLALQNQFEMALHSYEIYLYKVQ